MKIEKKIGGGGHVETGLTGTRVGVDDVSGSEKVWRSFQAIGDIAFAYAYSTVLIEIQVYILFLFLYQTNYLFRNFITHFFIICMCVCINYGCL